MPISVEVISPERTFVIISHVVAFAINALERMRAGQALGGFELKGLSFGLALQHHANPCDI